MIKKLEYNSPMKILKKKLSLFPQFKKQHKKLPDVIGECLFVIFAEAEGHGSE